MTLHYQHPKAVSIDHIVPLSLGGHNTKANVQLAHLGCNISKGNRGGGEQLRLIG
jgi:5-methylcytosine-specific restriction endonuclease McrA